MRMVPELKVMIKGMLAGLRSVSIASFLLLCITYVFAIAFRLLTSDTTVGGEHFRTVPRSAYTLLIEGMMPDNGSMMDLLANESWALGFVFFIFIFMASLTIMNMLIGILCEVVSGVTDTETEHMERHTLEERLRRLFHHNMDENGDELVQKPEFLAMLNDPEAIKAMENAGVDVFGLVDNADVIFEACQTQNLPFSDFIGVLWQFRATQAATVKAVSELRRMMGTNNRQLAAIEARLPRA